MNRDPARPVPSAGHACSWRWRRAWCLFGLTALAGAVGAGATESGGTALAAHAVPAYAQGLDVLPFPGTPDAAPGTNIDFPAVAPARIATVRVVGSRSGVHEGRLSAQPAGNGTAFTPERPFTPGEHVSVSAVMRSTAAAAASGSPGTRRLRFGFSVASVVPGGSAPAAAPRAARGARRATRATSAKLTHSYVSAPDLHPPIVTLSGKDTDTSSGDIFLDAHKDKYPGAYILDHRADLLWFHPSPSGSEFNTRVQQYQGRPVLTYWQGTINKLGIGHGEGQMLNEHYKVIHTVTAGNGLEKHGIDLHEFTLGHQGKEATAFVEVWQKTKRSLTSVGGPTNGTVIDWIIQEIDIKTNKVIWEWHSLAHVPISRTHQQYSPGQAFDYFHLNSIQQLSDGHIIISARNTWAVYSIDKATGKIVWQLGGKHATLKEGQGANFEFQHDATLHANGLLTVFDDAAPPPQEKQSRGLELHLALSKHKATLIHQYTHSPPTLAYGEGSVQLLHNNNVFVGWGGRPYFSEYHSGGGLVFGGAFHVGVQSYRAYRFNNWVGKPTQPPAIAVRSASKAGHDDVYMSWNGSTKVAKWQLLVSSSRSGTFKKRGSPVAWSSFETKIDTSKANYFKVQALGAKGKVLSHGISKAVTGP